MSGESVYEAARKAIEDRKWSPSSMPVTEAGLELIAQALAAGEKAERERESIKKDRDETEEALSLAENRRKETVFKLMTYTVRAETAEARVKELEAALGKMIDAVQWMSGSDDFATSGKAHDGWVKIRDEMSQAMKVWRPKP